MVVCCIWISVVVGVFFLYLLVTVHLTERGERDKLLPCHSIGGFIQTYGGLAGLSSESKLKAYNGAPIRTTAETWSSLALDVLHPYAVRYGAIICRVRRNK